jgi:hypothetical protein
VSRVVAEAVLFSASQESMRHITVLELDSHTRLVEVRQELYAKGFVFIAQDVRKQFLIISQRAWQLQEAVQKLTNESVCVCSLYEAAAGDIQRGRTGSWAVTKVVRENAAQHVEALRPQFQRTVLACTSPRNWSLSAPTSTACPPADPHTPQQYQQQPSDCHSNGARTDEN